MKGKKYIALSTIVAGLGAYYATQGLQDSNSTHFQEIAQHNAHAAAHLVYAGICTGISIASLVRTYKLNLYK